MCDNNTLHRFTSKRIRPQALSHSLSPCALPWLLLHPLFPVFVFVRGFEISSHIVSVAPVCSASGGGVGNDDWDCERRAVVPAPEATEAGSPLSRRPLLRFHLHFPSICPLPSLQLSPSYPRGTRFHFGDALVDLPG